VEDLHDNYGPEARYAVQAEAALPSTKWEQEIARGLELGLSGADSIVDRRIPTFSRGSCRTSPVSTPSSRRRTSRTSAAAASTTWRCSRSF
jgi:hypothetical protein